MGNLGRPRGSSGPRLGGLKHPACQLCAALAVVGDEALLLAVTAFVDGPAAAITAFQAEAGTNNTGYASAFAALRADFSDEALLKSKLLARRVPTGDGGLRLVVPKEEGVLHPAQVVNGFKLVSDVQIYLDLLRAGLRGEEQAAELRRWPDFAGGWA